MSATAAERLPVRWWRENDLPRLVALLQQGFPAEQWTADDVLAFAGRRDSGHANVIKTLCYEHEDGPVIGVMLYTLEDEACRFRRIVVDEPWQRSGAARHAVAGMISPNSLIRRRTFLARIRESRWQGAALFTNCGFTLLDQRWHYQDGELGYVFRYQRPVRPKIGCRD